MVNNRIKINITSKNRGNNMTEDYFKHFPTIDFDLKNDGNLIEAKDIFRNIRVSE